MGPTAFRQYPQLIEHATVKTAPSIPFFEVSPGRCQFALRHDRPRWQRRSRVFPDEFGEMKTPGISGELRQRASVVPTDIDSDLWVF